MEQHALGFNYRLTDIQSALGVLAARQARRASSPRRNAIADRYRAELADVDALELPPAAPAGALHAYHLFVDPPPRRRRRPAGALRRPARARRPRPGPLHPGLPAPLVPRDLRLRARAVPGRRALLRGLPVAAVLPGADRSRAGHGHRRRARARSLSSGRRPSLGSARHGTSCASAGAGRLTRRRRPAAASASGGPSQAAISARSRAGVQLCSPASLPALVRRVDVQLDVAGAPAADGALDHARVAAVIGPAGRHAVALAQRGDRREVALLGRHGIGGDAVQQRQVGALLATADGGVDLGVGRHARGDEQRQAGVRARAQEVVPQQLVGGDLEEVDVRRRGLDRPAARTAWRRTAAPRSWQRSASGASSSGGSSQARRARSWACAASASGANRSSIRNSCTLTASAPASAHASTSASARSRSRLWLEPISAMNRP